MGGSKKKKFQKSVIFFFFVKNFLLQKCNPNFKKFWGLVQVKNVSPANFLFKNLKTFLMSFFSNLKKKCDFRVLTCSQSRGFNFYLRGPLRLLAFFFVAKTKLYRLTFSKFSNFFFWRQKIKNEKFYKSLVFCVFFVNDVIPGRE